MLKHVILVAALAAVAQAGFSKKMLDMAKGWAFMDKCWGEENSNAFYKMVMEHAEECQKMPVQYTAETFMKPEQLPRVAKQARPGPSPASLLNEIEDPEMRAKMQEFVTNFGKMKMMMMEKVSNVTCLMKHMGAMNEDDSVNIDYFTTGMWEGMDDIDPDFKKALVEKYEMCHKYTQSIPMEELTKNPIMLKFGRQMKFQKCQLKFENQLCAKKQMSDYMEAKYGPFDADKAALLGMPDMDKFEVAYMKKKVMKMSMPKTLKFAMDFVFEGPEM